MRKVSQSVTMIAIFLIISTISTFTQSNVDYGTLLGNCMWEYPVFGRLIDGGCVGCYGKYEFVLDVQPRQSVYFYDVNYMHGFGF